MTHRRAAHLALAASTSLTALVGCGAARATAPATPNAAVVAPTAQTTVAAARAERVPVLSRSELRVGTWAEAARLDVKQVFQFEGRPTIVLANVDEAAATGSPRVVDGRGDASLVRELSEAKAADADLVGEVVTIFDQGALCHAEVVGLQVGAFAHFDDGRTRSARAIWDKASSYGALYLLGELRGGECLDGLTEAEAVVGAAEAVPLRIADAELRRATLPVLAALPAYHDAQGQLRRIPARARAADRGLDRRGRDPGAADHRRPAALRGGVGQQRRG